MLQMCHQQARPSLQSTVNMCQNVSLRLNKCMQKANIEKANIEKAEFAFDLVCPVQRQTFTNAKND